MYYSSVRLLKKHFIRKSYHSQFVLLLNGLVVPPVSPYEEEVEYEENPVPVLPLPAVVFLQRIDASVKSCFKRQHKIIGSHS